MTPIFKKHGQVIMSLVVAIIIVFTALLTKDSEYENAWLYVFIVWMFLSAAFDIYSNYKKNKDKGQ